MTTTDTTKHGAVPLFGDADDCGHPEPADDTTLEWNDWEDDHPVGTEGRLCRLDPMGSCCLACTEAAAEEEDLPIGEYVACRVVATP